MSQSNTDDNVITPENIQLFQEFTQQLDGETNCPPGPRQVQAAMWSKALPASPTNPQLIAFVPEMAASLNIDLTTDPVATARIFSGQQTLPGSLPYAMRYGGHQFGNWAGQLGDGRAIALGELADRENKKWTLQLKGAGPTPYSRQGDGYAVLRSSVREFLCAEAMHHLGIPTTRSLTLCTTGDNVERDIFYNGNVESEPGAVLCRVAESFIRFGSFEIHAAHGETDQLVKLANYVIREHYPHWWNGKPTTDTYQRWFNELTIRTAHMVADWQRVGFVHAVMNTDNMSILGQTIDYGPYGWLEEYDLSWTPNFVDRQGRRYSYGNQPQIALWNLYRLANAVLPLFNDDPAPLKEILESYDAVYNDHFNKIRAAKIGLHGNNPHDTDDELTNDLWQLLEQTAPDFTVFFRTLSTADLSQTVDQLAQELSAAYYQPVTHEQHSEIGAWLGRWQSRLQSSDSKKAQALMKSTNPKYVLRNYIAMEAIDAAEKGDFTVLNEVHNIIRKPYEEQPPFEKYAALRPEWATQRPGCTMLTCSS